jgi:hypothetical protein
MFVFGGVDDRKCRFNDLFSFHFQKREWQCVQVTGCIPSARTFHRLVSADTLILLLAGYDGERKNDVHALIVGKDSEKRRAQQDQQATVQDSNFSEPDTHSEISLVSSNLSR